MEDSMPGETELNIEKVTNDFQEGHLNHIICNTPEEKVLILKALGLTEFPPDSVQKYDDHTVKMAKTSDPKIFTEALLTHLDSSQTLSFHIFKDRHDN